MGVGPELMAKDHQGGQNNLPSKRGQKKLIAPLLLPTSFFKAANHVNINSVPANLCRRKRGGAKILTTIYQRQTAFSCLKMIAPLLLSIAFFKETNCLNITSDPANHKYSYPQVELLTSKSISSSACHLNKTILSYVSFENPIKKQQKYNEF